MTSLEQKIRLTPTQRKRVLIFNALRDYGLSYGGAKKLAACKGISELIEKESLPPNPLERPPIITITNGRVDPQSIRQDYRARAAKYLNVWIRPPIDTTMAWTTYQALIPYCKSKVR